MKTRRTIFVIVGPLLIILARILYGFVASVDAFLFASFIHILGIGLMFYGCYLWTKIKNRHWAWTLWGLLSYWGYIGLALLKDKSKETSDE